MLATLLLALLPQEPTSGLDDLREQASALAPAAVLRLADTSGAEASDELLAEAAGVDA